MTHRPAEPLRHRLLWPMLLALWIGLLTGPAAGDPGTALAPRALTSAEFSQDDGASWLTVPLPDRWAGRVPSHRAAAQYRLAFDLPAVPAGAQALRFARLGMHHRISLNGQLLRQRGDGPDFVNRRGDAPALIDVPPALLRSGRNELLVEVQHAVNGALSAPELGPTDSLRRRHARDEALQVDLPRALNLASLGLALFMLTVWLRRRSEVALGCFGALSLLAALRNLSYFTTVDLAPPGLLDWFFYATQVSTAVLLALFARALTGQRADRYLQALVALGLLALLGAAVAAVLDNADPAARLALGNAATRMGQLRRWTYPLMLLALVPPLGWLLRQARRQPTQGMRMLAVGSSALMLGGLHDYALLTGHALLAEQFTLPFIFPMVLGAMSVFLVARMVAATGAAEALARELDERVAARTEQLSQANAAKARFLSAASHDLRQPVMTIGLLVGLLRGQPAADAGSQRLLGKLHGATQALQALLDGLLDLSRLDPLLVQPRLQAVPLQALFEAIALHAQPEADRKQLRLVLRPTTLAAMADPTLLEQMLRNLVGNALRYTAQGGVLVAARRVGRDRLRLQVWDTGIGIAPQDQARVFEEFVQVGNPGRDRQLGQGLGLAIVARSAAALGCRVNLRSVPGRGSCFSVELPRAAAEQALPLARTVPPPPAGLPLQGRLLWVLDDDETLREVLRWRLQAWGARVQTLDSPDAMRQAISQARQAAAAPPDLLLTDLRLGQGSGQDAIDLLNLQWSGRVPSLLLTGDASSDLAQQLRRQGVPVLAKPASDEGLLAAIEEALQALR